MMTGHLDQPTPASPEPDQHREVTWPDPNPLQPW